LFPSASASSEGGLRNDHMSRNSKSRDVGAIFADRKLLKVKLGFVDEKLCFASWRGDVKPLIICPLLHVTNIFKT
jgi:hypothetical protein